MKGCDKKVPYGQLLNVELGKKNITETELAQRLGVTPGYINKIINGKRNPPSEKLNEKIAKILDLDVRTLNIEGYFDKAPREIKDIIYVFVKANIQFVSAASKKAIKGRNAIDVNNWLNTIREAPIGVALLKIIDYKDMIIKNTEKLGEELEFDDENTAILKLLEPFSIKVGDDGYAPIIPKNTKIRLEEKEKYLNGDIVALNCDNKIVVRKLMIKNGYCMFMPQNGEYLLIQLTEEDAKNKIVGKVKSYIIEL